MKTQKGIALIWVIIAGALLITGVGVVASKKEASRTKEPQLEVSPTPTPPPSPAPKQVYEEDIYQDEPLLKILPPKERAELESAIREAQEVLQNIQPFNPSDILNTDNMFKGLDEINKQAQEQIQKNIEKQQQEFQPIDPKEIEEYFKEHPPAVPHEEKEIPPEAQEYYYRKYIMKDPAFQY